MKILQLLLSEVSIMLLFFVNIRTINVQMANMATLTDFDIDSIVKGWKNISHLTIGQEKDLCNLFTFTIDILVFMAMNWT
jgi:hypothetical protein